MDYTPRMQRSPKREVHRKTINEKVYPCRHCLMISGGILIVIDMGLFIGGVSIIASGIDMDIYGFAVMITFSVLTMVLACLAVICGYRAQPPRSLSYTRPVTDIPSLSSKPLSKQPLSHPQPQRIVHPHAEPSSKVPNRQPPPTIIIKQDRSMSEWSQDATWGSSTALSDLRPWKPRALPKHESDV